MLATSLLLVRHGRTLDNIRDAGARLTGWYDPPLSADGVQEAEELANHLREHAVAALYTSTLARARQTAWPLALSLGLYPRNEPDLREISCGELDGVPLAEVQQRFPDLWQGNLAQSDEDFQWPGGETYRGFRRRVLRTIRRLARTHRGQTIMLVTHAGVISQTIGWVHNTSAARWELWRPRNGSMSEVRWHRNGGALVRFDWRPSAAPDEVRAAQDAQLIACGPRRLGARPRRLARPATGDHEVVP
jgi:broad specificity phosphatase PhoE